MTVRDRIIEHLRNHPEGVDDDRLTATLGLSRRQHANQECRKLVTAGLVERHVVCGKTRSFLRDGGDSSTAPAEPVPPARSLEAQLNPNKPWDWEGNVQSAAVAFLVSNRFTMNRVADTLTREHGKDIVAVAPSGRELWVSVKGRPEETARTTSYLMARHYFEGAVHDLLCWREEKRSAALALAFPEFVTYRNGAKRVAGQLQELKASVFWVFEDRKVQASPNFL
jgi:hypothetical protein